MQENLTSFASRLKLLREERGRTQREMGELIGCSASNYQKMEYGQVNIPILTLCALADYFGVTADYLLGRSDRRT